MAELSPLGGCPYPTIDAEGNIRSGDVLDQPTICQRCQGRPCKGATSATPKLRELSTGVHAGTCGRGADFAVVAVEADSLVLNGLLIRDLGKDKSRRLKRELAGNEVDSAQIASWRGSQVQALEARARDIDERIREALEMFHDVQTAASSIIRSAERLQASQPGRNDDEKFGALPPAAQTLVKAAGLLELRLRTMPIVTNPAAAAYGNRRGKPIYRIVDMLVRILQPVADNKNVSLALRGASHRNVPVFESFDLLPLTLIENALKYSARGQRVEVTVNDTEFGVSVAVLSFSPWIEPTERQMIFERRYRANGARAVRPEGYGLGLSIAEAVANAHGTRVLLWTDEGNELVDGVRFCNNRFFFNLR